MCEASPAFSKALLVLPFSSLCCHLPGFFGREVRIIDLPFPASPSASSNSAWYLLPAIFLVLRQFSDELYVGVNSSPV